MAFNGSGVFNRLRNWATDKTNSVPVTASLMDSEMDGFATGLSNCITKDGQQTITAAIPWNSQNLTGVGVLTVTGSTASTSSSTGAGIITGGLGVGGSVFSGGALRATSQPCFSAHKNGTDQTGIANTVSTKITFTTEEFDIGGFYDAANSKWTPPAGMVFIVASVPLTNHLSGSVGRVDVYKNGASYKRVVVSQGAATNDGLAVYIVDRANGTDFYEIYLTAATSTTITASGLVTSTYFMGFVI